MASGKADADILHLTGLADNLDIHRRAADLAIFDGRVVALGRVGGRGNDLPAMRALDLDFDEHDAL